MLVVYAPFYTYNKKYTDLGIHLKLSPPIQAGRFEEQLSNYHNYIVLQMHLCILSSSSIYCTMFIAPTLTPLNQMCRVLLRANIARFFEHSITTRTSIIDPTYQPPSEDRWHHVPDYAP